MARLPFEADIVVGQRVEHQLPGVGIVGDVPVAARPVAVHGAVLEGDAHALVGGALGERPEDLPEARQRRLDRLAADAAGEAGDAGRAEEMGVVDQRLPAAKGLAVGLGVLERVAEHAEGRDRDVMAVDGFEQLAGEPRDVLVADGLPEERLDALETMRQDLLHIARRVRRVAADHGADADVAKRVAHAGTAICGIAGIRIATWRPVSALSIAPKTMARLWILSSPRVSGAVPLPTADTKSRMMPRWPPMRSESRRAEERRPAERSAARDHREPAHPSLPRRGGRHSRPK